MWTGPDNKQTRADTYNQAGEKISHIGWQHDQNRGGDLELFAVGQLTTGAYFLSVGQGPREI